MLGVSTVSTFAESTAGVADGAKTGLASLVTGSCFLLAIPFSPIVSAASRPHACVCVREREGERERENERTRERSGIQCVLSLKSEVPPLASGPILCLLGAMMCSSVRGVDWDDFQESIIMSQEGESFGTTDKRKVYQVYQGPAKLYTRHVRNWCTAQRFTVYSRTAK